MSENFASIFFIILAVVMVIGGSIHLEKLSKEEE